MVHVLFIFIPGKLNAFPQSTWGRSAQWAFDQVLEAKEATLSPDLVDFQVTHFGEHWRQCIAAAMAKGAAAVLSRSASPGELASERTSTEASQESHPDSGL